jgi:hypothetical protein
LRFRLEGGTFAHIDCTYSHSLATSLLWCALYAALFARSGARSMALMFVAAFSHWPLDVLSHHPDIDLWPHSRVEVGFGSLFGGFGGWLELACTIAGSALYVRSARRSVAHGRHWPIAVAIVAVLYAGEVLVVRASERAAVRASYIAATRCGGPHDATAEERDAMR